MDASAEQASCPPFVAIANLLQAAGLSVPEIIASDCAAGFLLLTDFGDQRYLDALTAETADQLYTRALDALCRLQYCSPRDAVLLSSMKRYLAGNAFVLGMVC